MTLRESKMRLIDGTIASSRYIEVIVPNQDGLESAKPDLQPVFKKPGRDTSEP